WMKSAKNTAICLLGCSIGDNLTIYLFQILNPSAQMSFIMLTAMLFGLLTSIILETIILSIQIPIKKAIYVALGMSFISMLMMEASANFTGILLAGGNRLVLTWWSILPSWIIGYLSALIYNYYNIKKYGKSCHG
ncbi:MAG: DUF4396 domain-containing protein, partial [Gammaproteobacteria bacterium]|nr:DUF4396 domain-containing protein [Gammaproteobacteria bacterium]